MSADGERKKRGRPKLPQDVVKSDYVVVRFSAVHRETLRRLSREWNTTQSDAVRRLLDSVTLLSDSAMPAVSIVNEMELNFWTKHDAELAAWAIRAVNPYVNVTVQAVRRVPRLEEYILTVTEVPR